MVEATIHRSMISKRDIIEAQGLSRQGSSPKTIYMKSTGTPTDTTGVTPHIRRGDVRDGRVGVVRLANILVSICDVAIDDESLEVVVGEDGREEGRSGQEAGGGVHVDGYAFVIVVKTFISVKERLLVVFVHQGQMNE